MRLAFYGLLAICAIALISLVISWRQALRAKPDPRWRIRSAAFGATISYVWLILAVFMPRFLPTMPRLLPTDDSRAWTGVILGNPATLLLITVGVILGRGTGKFPTAAASALVALCWISVYVIDSLIVV